MFLRITSASFAVTVALMSVTCATAKEAAVDTTAANQFFAAIRANDVASVEKQLQAQPALVRAHNRKGRSAVLVAMFVSVDDAFVPVAKNEMLRTLLAKSPPLEFYELCGLGRAAEVAKQVKAHPDLATSWTKWGWSVLHLAAFSGDAETVRILVEHGADIQARARTPFLNTPLQTALLAGQYDT